MYKIEQTDYGFRVTSAGSFTVDEVERLRVDLLGTLSTYNRPFHSFSIRARWSPPPDVRDIFVQLHGRSGS